MKRVLAIILVIIMCITMTFSVYADNVKYVYDEGEFITSASEDYLNEKATGIYEKTGIVVSYLVVDEAPGGTVEYAEKSYNKYFGNEDGILLCETSTEWYIYEQGEADSIFTDGDIEKMWDACGNASYYNEGVEAYLDVAAEILYDKGVVASEEDLSATDAVTIGATLATDPNHPPRLVDDADLLTVYEGEELHIKLDEISERQMVDVAIVTVDSLEGKTAQAFADDYYDYNGYGMGDSDDGIMLVISMGEREWAISTYAFGSTAFTDEGNEYIMDIVVPYLSDGDYYGAFNQFADLCDNFIAQAKTGEPYDIGNMPDDVGMFAIILWVIPSLLIAALISLLLKKLKRKSLKMVMMRNDASDYWEDMELTEDYDQYLRMTLSTIKIKGDDDNVGGSSIHMGSSGRIHGGASGKF